MKIRVQTVKGIIMDISYDEVEDILFIHLSHDPIIRDISYGWHVNVGMTATGIGQITILETNGKSRGRVSNTLASLDSPEFNAPFDDPVEIEKTIRTNRDEWND